MVLGVLAQPAFSADLPRYDPVPAEPLPVEPVAPPVVVEERSTILPSWGFGVQEDLVIGETFCPPGIWMHCRNPGVVYGPNAWGEAVPRRLPGY